jgi:hypothetical protein
MGIKNGDLVDSVLKKVSLDEFEPKTGDERNVAVLGFHVTTDGAAQDLYSFLNGSIVETRDVEVSPNPNDEGYYMVFVELDRTGGMMESVEGLIAEVENVAGQLRWQVKTPYMEDYLPIDEASKYIQTDADDYLTAQEYKDKLEQELNTANLESARNESIMEFLSKSNLHNVQLEQGVLTLKDARNSINLEVLGFGNGTEVMEEIGIYENAINLNPDVKLFNGLKGMLGEMKAMPIDDLFVIYDPAHTNVLVTKPC